MTVVSPDELTPWENRDGRWYKREDYHRNDYGVNGAKYRACRHLMERAILNGADHVVSASSVLSPQAAIAATLAEELGVGCTVLVGASRPETAVKHPSIQIAVEAGAWLDTSTRVAYNPVIQRAGERLALNLGAWQLPYGITTPKDAAPDDVDAFLQVGGEQVKNLPEGIETLVLPFGSGNTTAGVLWGLLNYGTRHLRELVLVGVGPDRMKWLEDRLDYVGCDRRFLPPITHTPLHGWFADYGDKMPETVDGIVMHPTYEGKVVRFLNLAEPEWWTRRDGTTCLWIVGGPIG